MTQSSNVFKESELQTEDGTILPFLHIESMRLGLGPVDRSYIKLKEDFPINIVMKSGKEYTISIVFIKKHYNVDSKMEIEKLVYEIKKQWMHYITGSHK